MESLKLSTLALSTVLSALAVAQDTHRAPETVPQEGVVVLTPTKGQQAQGVLLLKQTQQGVQVTGKVSGLEPGEHGFHIHEFGDRVTLTVTRNDRPIEIPVTLDASRDAPPR